MNDEAISPREVLHRAAQAVGGEEKLAALLEIDLTELETWLSGMRLPPFGACIRALAVLERHRQLEEPSGVLSIGAAAGVSLERFVRLAGMTSLLLTIGPFLFGLFTLSSFTKLIAKRP